MKFNLQIRHILANGSLYFPPFQGESFRQDVHWAAYKCIAVNSIGTVISRDAFVKAGKEACWVEVLGTEANSVKWECSETKADKLFKCCQRAFGNYVQLVRQTSAEIPLLKCCVDANDMSRRMIKTLQGHLHFQLQ